MPAWCVRASAVVRAGRHGWVGAEQALPVRTQFRGSRSRRLCWLAGVRMRRWAGSTVVARGLEAEVAAVAWRSERLAAAVAWRSERLAAAVAWRSERLAAAVAWRSERLAAAAVGSSERLAAAAVGSSERLAAAAVGSSERLVAAADWANGGSELWTGRWRRSGSEPGERRR